MRKTKISINLQSSTEMVKYFKNYFVIFHMLSIQKNVKKKYWLSGVGGIRTHDLAAVGSWEGFEESLFNPWAIWAY